MEEKLENNTINKYKRNSHQKKQVSTIVSSATNFISEEVHTNGINSESNFITKENVDMINDNNKIKWKFKQSLNLKENKLILSKKIKLDLNEINEKKNEEIYNYLMKNEDIKNIKDITELFEYNQISNFIFSRLKKNQILECNIFIDSNNNDTNYILYSNKHKFILSAKYDFSLFHNNYIIYTSRDFLPKTAIANLHSYSNKSEFILYDMGISPKSFKNKKFNTSNNFIKIRRYLLQINYLNNNKFDDFKVYLPKNDYFENCFYNMDENHKIKLNNKKLENDINIMENSKPKYDINTKKYLDNFSDRVKEKSKFNFKIIYDNIDNKKYTAIECGKINDKNYALNIGYPFSPLEGFAVALANFIKNK